MDGPDKPTLCVAEGYGQLFSLTQSFVAFLRPASFPSQEILGFPTDTLKMVAVAANKQFNLNHVPLCLSWSQCCICLLGESGKWRCILVGVEEGDGVTSAWVSMCVCRWGEREGERDEASMAGK